MVTDKLLALLLPNKQYISLQNTSVIFEVNDQFEVDERDATHKTEWKFSELSKYPEEEKWGTAFFKGASPLQSMFPRVFIFEIIT